MGAEDLALEEFMTPTTCGRLFRCSYFIQLHFEHAGLSLGMGQSIPNVCMNMCIFPPTTYH